MEIHSSIDSGRFGVDSSPCGRGVADSVATEADFNVKDVIFGHTGDSYEWHITNIGEKSIAIPLPVIIRSKTSGWHVFSSAEVEEGHQYEGFYISEESGKIVERNATIGFVNHEECIVNIHEQRAACMAYSRNCTLVSQA